MSDTEAKEAASGQIRGSTLLLVGRGLSVGLNFLSQVITVRYLVKEDYGALAYALAMASFFGNASRFGMDKAVSRIAAIQEEHREYAHMFGTLLTAVATVILCGTSIATAVWALGDVLGARVVTDPRSLDLLLILIALAPVQAMDHLMQSTFAIFSRPRLIFFRKYVVGPGLKLAAVLTVMAIAGDARDLAMAHLVAGFLGLGIGLTLAGRVLGERDLLSHFRWRDVRVSTRRVFGYAMPMLGSDLVLLLRGAMVVFLLEFAHGSTAVADFRAVLPVARLNNVALESFAFLFIPAVARLTTRKSGALDTMYWRSATWVTVLSLPIFLVTFCLARPVTVLLFSERYASAALVLAILSAGAFVNAVLSMSGHALKAAGRVREVLVVDGAALALMVTLTLVLVPRYGAVGGAAAMAIAGVAHGIAYHVVLSMTLDVNPLPRGLGRVYGILALLAAGILALDAWVAPSIWVQIPLVVLAWSAVLVAVAPRLAVEDTFPELLRLPVIGPLVRRALKGRRDDTPDDTTREIRTVLEEPATPLADDLGAPPYRAALKRTSKRPGSTIVECDLEGPTGRMPILVKAVDVGAEARPRAAGDDYPRLGKREHPATILTRERATLRAIHEHFEGIRDPRFRSVRVLDVAARDGLVAMERLPHPTLHTMIQRHGLRAWGGASDLLETASENTGAWLRTFHAMPPLGHTGRRHATRASFLTSLEELTGFLVERRKHRAFLEELCAELSCMAEGVLPRELPIGLAHGDYAPRNVLVGPSGSVAVIDTQGRWQSAKHLDLGYFIANLWTPMPAALSRGLLPGDNVLASVERAFLRGYFKDPGADLRPVKLYEALVLLARWASGVHAGAGPNRSSLGRNLLYRARESRIRGRLEETLATLRGRTTAGEVTPRP